MQAENKTSVNTEGELEITRVFDAPRPLVWRCWTEEELFKQWFGPMGFTIPHCTIDLRVGEISAVHACSARAGNVDHRNVSGDRPRRVAGEDGEPC